MPGLTAGEILAIPDHAPHKLFKEASVPLKTQYIALVKEWHPDRVADDQRPQANKVATKIGELYRLALEMERQLADGTGDYVLKVSDSGTDNGNVRVRKRVQGSLYSIGIAESRVYEVMHRDLIDKSIGFEYVERGFPIKSPALASVRQFLPARAGPVMTVGKSMSWGIDRPGEAVRLSDALLHVKRFEPKTAAWIVSGMYNLMCYCGVHDVVFNALSPDNVWIDATTHRVMLLSGWVFARKVGGSVSHVPAFVRDNADVQKSAAFATDLRCAKAICRILFGDRSGMKFPTDTPKELAAFSTNPTTGSAVSDYSAWEKAREAAFGARKFVKFDLKFDHVY